MASLANGPAYASSAADPWVQALAAELGTTDGEFAFRVLGAWLRMLRNRLTVETSDRFAAQLPGMIRELFYENWDPHAAPVKGDSTTYTIRFARAVRIAVQDVSQVASATTAAVFRIAPAEVEKALAELTPDLRTVIAPPRVLQKAS